MNKVVTYLPEHKDLIKLRKFDNLAFVYDSLDAYAEYGQSFSLLDNNNLVIAMGGIVAKWPGVGIAWIAAQEELNPYRFIFAKNVKKELNRIAFEVGYHRIETTVRTDFPEAVKFIEWLGFDKEGLLKQGLPGKVDCYSYAKLY